MRKLGPSLSSEIKQSDWFNKTKIKILPLVILSLQINAYWFVLKQTAVSVGDNKKKSKRNVPQQRDNTLILMQ